MGSNDRYKLLIETAYEEFAVNGPDFSLKALSKKTNLPRATFYYYFNNKEHLITELLNCHLELTNDYHIKIRKIKALIPDLYEIMFEYENGIRFHQQLLRNSHVKEYQEIYNEINLNSIKILLPLIKPYFGNNLSDKEIYQFFNTLTDAWYSRLNFSNFSVNYMVDLAEEIMNNTVGAYQKNKL